MSDAGLGKRVSDLEAEVRMLKARVKVLEDRRVGVPGKLVQSGNSRVKVTLYGQINRAVRFAFSANNTEITHVDNDASGSRIGVLATGSLFPGVTIGGRIEFGTRQNHRSATNDGTDGVAAFQVRHSELFVETDFGTLYMGHGYAATDGVTNANLSGTGHIFDSGGCGQDAVTFNSATGGAGVAPACGNFEGGRENRIMYETPGLYGVKALVSHGEGDAFEAAIVYEGTPFGRDMVEIAASAGFTNFPGSGAATPTAPPTGRGRTNTFEGSIAILHVPTGLNFAIAGGRSVDQGSSPNPENPGHFYITAGWKGKIWSMGGTALSVHYGRYDHITVDNHHYMFGAAINQKIDAAATDFYLGVRYIDGKTGGTNLGGITIVLVGARIKF